jgi:predicted HNH restriction endonuclease
LQFHKHEKYRRHEIWELVKGKGEKISRNFQQSGYERIDDNLFAFVNIGYQGHAGQTFPNRYDSKTERLLWYGKKETHSNQPLMKRLIDGDLRFYCFARWNEDPNFTFLGTGKLVNYRDDFTEVFNKDGTRTFCLELEFDLRDSSIHPAWINNFDASFEGDPPDTTEGKEKYVRHKTRERDPAIVKEKKSQFLQEHGRTFCEACGFDFKKAYGTRGDGFIECHHNIPLHSIEGETQTKISDLTLLCSNCHRMVHRTSDWLTFQQLKKLLVSPRRLGQYK